MSAAAWESTEGGFRLDLGDEGWAAAVAVDDESFFAVDFHPPDGSFLLRVQRFRREIPVADLAQFEAVLEGVLIGIEESFNPMKLLERKVMVEGDGVRADLVLRGKRIDVDIIERRRLLATGPVPPGRIFLLTAACPAERFLVHRRDFERIFDSFEVIETP